MKVLVDTLNQKKVLVGAFSVIVKLQTFQRLISSSTGHMPGARIQRALMDLGPLCLKQECSKFSQNYFSSFLHQTNIQQALNSW